jgi:predicted nuclease with RNAse H fold
MIGPMPCWLGVDVGGKRKGFDVAIVDDRRLVALAARLSRDAVVRRAETWAPTVVGIDSPRCWAPEGETARLGERLLNRAVCGIRWTPDVRAGAENGYYAWIREGLALFGALEALGIAVIEVFPTASWTRWHGDRGAMTRARWSRAALESLGLEGIPQRTNQDQRDAIAAAVTARQHTMRTTEAFGEIVVPASPA